jgi:hypothetical protein
MNCIKQLILLLTLFFCLEAQTGVIVPFYTEPTTTAIQPLIAAKKSHPSVPLRVILDLGVTEDSTANSQYAQSITQLKAAGIEVLGRVNTDFNLRSLNEVMLEVKNWKDQYSPNGIFLDSLGASATYYKEIVEFIHAVGMSLAVGNAGDNVDPTYGDYLDTMVIANQSGLPSLADYTNWNHSSINPNLSAFLLYNVASLPTDFITQASKFIGWIYVTNGSGTAPYKGLPAYFSALVTLFDLNQNRTGSIVPFYIYPTTAAIQPLINAKRANPNVPIIVVLNPNSGPGNAVNADYTKAITALKQEGIIVTGYVHTSYGARNIDLVKNEVNQWFAWYKPDGIFFDEMGLNHPYYQAINTHTKSLGGIYTIGNPGYAIDVSTQNDLDIINIFENAMLPDLNSFGQWVNAKVPKNKMSTLSYNIATNQPVFINNASKTFGWIYYTSGAGANPWGVLPPYFGAMIQSINQANSAQ